MEDPTEAWKNKEKDFEGGHLSEEEMPEVPDCAVRNRTNINKQTPQKSPKTLENCQTSVDIDINIEMAKKTGPRETPVLLELAKRMETHRFDQIKIEGYY